MDKLFIARQDYREIIEYCKSARPNEACGMMAGIIDDGIGKVNKVYYMSNKEASPENYLMEPEEQFEVFRDIRENNLELISIYHSHPHTPARPSQKDIEMAYYPETVYSILSLQDEKPVLRGYLISDEDYKEIDIEIKDDKLLE